MGKKILIYDNGQRYEIDSDQIYVPAFDTESKDKNKNGQLQKSTEYSRNE